MPNLVWLRKISINYQEFLSEILLHDITGLLCGKLNNSYTILARNVGARKPRTGHAREEASKTFS